MLLRTICTLSAAGLAAAAAGVMNADACNRSDTNQLWLLNSTHGSATHQLTVRAAAADADADTDAAEERCAALVVKGCAVDDFSFVSTAACAPADCAEAQAFDVLESATKLPAPAGAACASCVVRSRLNTSLCFGVGAELGGVKWKVSAPTAAGEQTLEMIGAHLCLTSGFETSPYPISLQECEY